jgi:hypothetical protein
MAFSYHNSPCFIETDLTIPDRPTKGPRKLVRQTNEWINYFGDFPAACAEISGKINGTHVLEVPVNSRVLLLHPTRKEVKDVQRDVRDKVELVYSQLELFADSGIIAWKKETGGAEVRYGDETVTLYFKLCEETSMFHVVMSGDPENFASFLYCLRMIFITPGLFVSFDFDLTQEDVDRASVVTRERFVVKPKEENPDWMTDENADWKP